MTISVGARDTVSLVAGDPFDGTVGTWLIFDYAWEAYAQMLWLKIKLILVALLVVYHFYCGKIIRQLASNTSHRSHVWFRWFNELPVIILFVVVILAVVKPF